MLLTGCTSESEVNAQTNDGQGATVYFTSDITAESLVKIYEALGVSPTATQRVGVKISTGESAQANYLRPDFIKPLVQKVGGNIVECNTAYGGTHIVDYAEQIGLGTKSYQLISLDQSSSIDGTRSAGSLRYNVYSLDGRKVLTNAASLDGLAKGTYIVNGEKTIIQ